jgi:hypothetical protein
MHTLNSRIMSYILNILICVCMILLDSLLNCFMLIAVIDLSSTFDSTIVSIYNLLFMFIIYFWIKIKLKVIILTTIQKPYFSHFSFMAGFVDALRPTTFSVVHFKIWQSRVTLRRTAMGVLWVSNCKPEGQLTPQQEKEYEEANTLFVGAVIRALANHL